MVAVIIMMAEADDDEIFVYMGGEQQVPDEVRRARIHKDVKIVRAGAFSDRRQLISVEFHDGIEIIEEAAFHYCISLRGAIKLLGIKIIKGWAFGHTGLTSVEFGDKLETIEHDAFTTCTGLTKIKMLSVRIVGKGAFGWCHELSDVEFGEALRALQARAFTNCGKLKRTALPLLKGNMIEEDVFGGCRRLETIDLVGGIDQTVASLHLESWRSDMNNEINRIYQALPTTCTWGEKSAVIQQWMERVSCQLNRYKAGHKDMMKEATTLLELALWKANLDDKNGGEIEREGVRTTRGSRKRARKEVCVTSGADVVIKNVLPFLALK